MYIDAKKNISIKISSMKKKRKWKRKRKKKQRKSKKKKKKKGKEKKKVIIKMIAFCTNDLEMVAKKAILMHPFDTIHLLRGPNWCWFGMHYSSIWHNTPLERTKLVPVWYALFIHLAQYASRENQIGAGLVCTIHPFDTIRLLGEPSWCRFGMYHSHIWHNTLLGRAKLVPVRYALFTHLAQYTS